MFRLGGQAALVTALLPKQPFKTLPDYYIEKSASMGLLLIV